MLTDILKQTPVSSIDDVLSIMTAIDSRLPDSDGLKWFNRLYMQVTRSIKQAVNPLGVSRRAVHVRAGRCLRQSVFRGHRRWRRGSLARAVRVASAFVCAAELRDCPPAVRASGHERAHQSRPAS